MSEPSITAQAPKDQMQAGLSLPNLMMRIGGELAALAQLSMRVQSALSEIDLKDHCPFDSIRDLQAIDRITQTLEDLAVLTETMSTVLPDTPHLSASELFASLTLTELIQNLDPPVGAQTSPDEDGDVLWF